MGRGGGEGGQGLQGGRGRGLGLQVVGNAEGAIVQSALLSSASSASATQWCSCTSCEWGNEEEGEEGVRVP